MKLWFCRYRIWRRPSESMNRPKGDSGLKEEIKMTRRERFIRQSSAEESSTHRTSLGSRIKAARPKRAPNQVAEARTDQCRERIRAYFHYREFIFAVLGLLATEATFSRQNVVEMRKITAWTVFYVVFLWLCTNTCPQRAAIAYLEFWTPSRKKVNDENCGPRRTPQMNFHFLSANERDPFDHVTVEARRNSVKRFRAYP